MFSDLLDHARTMAGLIDVTAPPGSRALQDLLTKAAEGGSLTPEELAGVMAATGDAEGRSSILAFSAAYRRPHDREVLLLPPLYFSSICENDCLYCDFSTDGERLSLDRFQEEFDALLGMGYRSIELVSSQDPALYLHRRGYSADGQAFAIDGALEYFHIAARRLAESGGGMLTSNVPPVDTGSMTQLKRAGLDCFLIWLECFDPEQYARLHYSLGPKSSQPFRVDSFDRARTAGIEHVAGAFLKGLYHWRKEEFVLYMLDRYLKQTYGRGFSIIGTPRLKGTFAKSELVRGCEVSDEDYELNIALDRVLFDGVLWLQTRESFETNRRLIDTYGAGVILTLSSSTAPGGYSAPARARAQFPVQKQDLSVSTSTLEQDGFRVHFDWDSESLRDFQRVS
jgi:2-iminoacetate synthase